MQQLNFHICSKYGHEIYSRETNLFWIIVKVCPTCNIPCNPHRMRNPLGNRPDKPLWAQWLWWLWAHWWWHSAWWWLAHNGSSEWRETRPWWIQDRKWCYTRAYTPSHIACYTRKPFHSRFQIPWIPVQEDDQHIRYRLHKCNWSMGYKALLCCVTVLLGTCSTCLNFTKSMRFNLIGIKVTPKLNN